MRGVGRAPIPFPPSRGSVHRRHNERHLGGRTGAGRGRRGGCCAEIVLGTSPHRCTTNGDGKLNPNPIKLKGSPNGATLLS